MSEIKDFHDYIYNKLKPSSPKVYIDVYEKNKTLIESSDFSISNPDFVELTSITSDYAMALSEYGNSTKAMPYLAKSINLFEEKYDELKNMSMYEMLKWYRGVENYNLKKYSLASKDFQFLVDTYPENDKYRNWLLASKTINLRKYLNYFWSCEFVCIFWYTLISKENFVLKQILIVVAIVLIVVAIFGEIMVALMKASIKKK